MPFGNLGFETSVAGSPGAAASWTLTVTSSVEAYGGFAAGSYQIAWESFDLGWDVDTWSTGLGATAAATFSSAILTPAPASENFSVGWDNDAWIPDIGATQAGQFDTTPQPFEDFEEEWDNDDWSTGLGPTTIGLFDSGAEPHEDFEDGWNTAGWSTAIGSSIAATFDGGAQDFEDFEQVWPPVLVSVDPSTDTLTAPAHGIANGTRVQLRSTGQPPGGVNPALLYFVVGSTTNTLQLAMTSGGSAIDIGHQGSGGHAILVDPSLYWNDMLDD